MFFCYLTNLGLSGLLVLSGRPFPGAWLWVIAQGLLTLGTGFDVVPESVPRWWPWVVGNSAYAASSVVFAHSVWVFRFSRRFPRWLYGIILVQFLSFVAVFDQPYWIRALTFSSWMTLGPLVTGSLLVWRVDRDYRLSHWLTAFPFLVLAGSSISRVILLSSVASSGNLAAVGPLNVWYVSGAILLTTIILFGYIMMTRVRAEQDMTMKDQEIEARNRKLVESSRAKDLFFSIIAHDLRGPIGGAARYVRKHLLGKMTGLEAKFTEVETLASALEKTNEFLEKLLWWSRAQLQDWVPDRVPLDLVQVFEQSHNLVRSSAEVKEITIHWPSPPFPKPSADPESVQLILANLLSNAVKFSLPGTSIRVLVVAQQSLCQIIVQDEGVGMDSTTLERLFRIEDKLTSHGTSGERGSGLGLILSKSLAERNDGGITIESEPGRGTKAILWLTMPNP